MSEKVLGLFESDCDSYFYSDRTKKVKIEINNSNFIPVRLASESVDLQFLEELLIKQIKRTDRFLRKDKRTVKDNFVFGKRYMAKKILSAIHTEMNKTEKEAKK